MFDKAFEEIYNVLDYIKDVFLESRIVWFFLFFVFGLLFYGFVATPSPIIREAFAASESILIAIATISATILTVSFTITPTMLSAANKKYRDIELSSMLLKQKSYIATKYLNSFLVGICLLLLLFAPKDYALMSLISNTIIFFVFLISLIVFLKFITTIEDFSTRIDHVLIEEIKKELDDLIK